MKLKRFFLSLLLLLTISTLFVFSLLQSAPVSAQVLYFTPTADASGAIYYIVKEGETCDGIALANNIPVDTLRTLNGLGFDECRFLQVGEKLILGTVPTAVITPGPSPTPTSILPTPDRPCPGPILREPVCARGTRWLTPRVPIPAGWRTGSSPCAGAYSHGHHPGIGDRLLHYIPRALSIRIAFSGDKTPLQLTMATVPLHRGDVSLYCVHREGQTRAAGRNAPVFPFFAVIADNCSGRRGIGIYAALFSTTTGDKSFPPSLKRW